MRKRIIQKPERQLSWEERMVAEERCWKEGYTRVAGADEAGRGPLAGPVVAAVFIIVPEFRLEGLKDSKQLSPVTRRKYCLILTSGHYEYGVGIVEPAEIDRINIYQASRLAMFRALTTLQNPPDFLLVDALVIPGTEIPQEPIVHGDARSVAIAAASVIAKETRDRIMEMYDEIYPGYGFAQHKGYPTRMHYDTLETLGPAPIHRKTFRLTKEAKEAEGGLFED